VGKKENEVNEIRARKKKVGLHRIVFEVAPFGKNQVIGGILEGWGKNTGESLELLRGKKMQRGGSQTE